MARRPGRPGLAEEQAEHVLAVLLRVRDTSYGGNNTTLAAALGMSPSAVSQLVSRKNRPSYVTAVSLASLLGAPVAAVLDGTAVAEPQSRRPDKYPERVAALARLRGLLPREVEERLCSVEVHDDRALSESEWVELALLQLREHERADALRRTVVVSKSRT